MYSTEKDEEDRKVIPLYPKVLDMLNKVKNTKLLAITKTHILNLLEYGEKVSTMGSSAFLNKGEYQKFAIAKFYVDKCLDAIIAESSSTFKEVEEGEINSDSEDTRNLESKKLCSEIPPLSAFHLSPKDKLTRLNNFFQNVRIGDIFNAKVVVQTEEEYVLLIINKYQNEERLIDLNINASMSKSCLKENLIPSEIVRVAVLAYNGNDNTGRKLIVTADSSVPEHKNKEINLGKILETDLPFSPIEAFKFRSFAQYITACDRDPRNLMKTLVPLGIDPYKSYCFHPVLDGKKGEVILNREKKECSEEEIESMQALKRALVCKAKGNIDEALVLVNRALELNSRYDSAYAVRGQLLVLKANNSPSSTLKRAAEDFLMALHFNSNNFLALQGISTLQFQSAIIYLEAGEYDEARETLECALQLHDSREAATLLNELDVYEKKWINDSKTLDKQSCVNPEANEGTSGSRPEINATSSSNKEIEETVRKIKTEPK